MGGESHIFDSFECAIQVLAPSCNHCGTRIIGHGIEAEGAVMYCCTNCAEAEGIDEAVDRV
jgi:ribosome-binding protein aMBF1 (putative translation factor)